MVDILPPTDEFDFVSVQSGLTNQIAHRLGLLQPHRRRFIRVALLIFISWIPLLLLAGLSGHVTGHEVAITLLRDPEANFRFLIALPILELAELVLAFSLAAQVRQFVESGIIADAQISRFRTILASVRRCHHSTISELAMFVLAIGGSLFMRLFVMPDNSSSWERLNNVITPAGWWHLLVSLPLLYFFLLRAIWIFVLWGWFLFRVSRLDLQLTATHPDRTGGLGFLGWGLASFSPIVFAFAVVASAGFATEIFHRGESLDSLKYHLIIYIALITLVVHFPVLPFAVRVARCRFYGLLEFSALVWRHDRAFDKKWIHQPQSENHETLLGTSDVQSLADFGTGYEHVYDMRIIPLDTKAVMVVVLASVIPMLPLIGTVIPLQEILTKLGEVLV